MMTRLIRWLGFAVLALVLLRLAVFVHYLCGAVADPYPVFHLESKFVHFAWRVQAGAPLYTNWREYPYIAAFFTPLYFWLVGGLGKLFGADIDSLFLIGRITTLGFATAYAGVIGGLMWRRFGSMSGVIAAAAMFGSAPMIGFGVMTRPDVMADALGGLGFVCALFRGRRGVVWGSMLVAAAILSKQSLGLYLVGIVLGLVVTKRFRDALLFSLIASGIVIGVIGVAEVVTGQPVASCVLGERHAPWSFEHWSVVFLRLALTAPDALVFPLVGMAFLWRERGGAQGTLAAAVIVGIGSIVIASKIGSDVNYFLPFRTAAAVVLSALASRRNPPKIADAGRLVGLLVACASMLSSTNFMFATAEWRSRRLFDRRHDPALRQVMLAHHSMQSAAEQADVRLLSDSDALALYQRERAAIVDVFLFALLVNQGAADPSELCDRIERGVFDFIILRADASADDYERLPFAFPRPVADAIRTHYRLVQTRAEFCIYAPQR